MKNAGFRPLLIVGWYRIHRILGTCEPAHVQGAPASEWLYDDDVFIDIPNAMRLAADALDNSLKRVEANRAETNASPVDPSAILDAFITLGQAGIAAAQELGKNIPKPNINGCGCEKSSEDLLDDVLSEELDRLVGRLGLVQEDELAALRKRVADLEAELKK